jgi:hypothetical protein
MATMLTNASIGVAKCPFSFPPPILATFRNCCTGFFVQAGEVPYMAKICCWATRNHFRGVFGHDGGGVVGSILEEAGNVCDVTEDWVESSEVHYYVAIAGIEVF